MLSIGTGPTVSNEIVFEKSLWYFIRQVLIPESQMWIRFISNEWGEYRGFIVSVARIANTNGELNNHVGYTVRTGV